MNADRASLLLGTSSFSEKSWPIWPAGARPADSLGIYADWIAALCAGLPGARPAVEVDSTYYGLPKAATVAAWARVAERSGLWMAAKVPETATHQAIPGGDLEGAAGTLQAAVNALSPLGPHLGALLLQFGYGFRHPDGWETLLRVLDRLPVGASFAVEFRHRSWLRDDVYAELAARAVPLALVDHPWIQGQRQARWMRATGPRHYVRLLGDRKAIEERIARQNRGDPPPGTPFDDPAPLTARDLKEHLRFDRVAQARDRDLDLWADFVDRELARGIPVFVAVNNHYEGCGLGTLERLVQRLVGRPPTERGPAGAP